MRKILLTLACFFIAIFSSRAQSLYGITYRGGSDDGGSLNRFSPVTKDLNVINSFPRSGANPYYTSLIQAHDGMLYGMTYNGGGEGNGVIFSYVPGTKKYAKLYDFNEAGGTKPTGSLSIGADGKFYGMTSFGGYSSVGVIFSFDPVNNSYTKLHDFDIVNGAHPAGSLTLASDGKFYGMTSEGGSSGVGIIFSFDPTNSVFKKLSDFDYITGGIPLGNLIQSSDGLLYGMSANGGSEGAGVIFSFDISTSVYLKLRDFDSTNGYYPYGSFIEANNGKLYAMTLEGGSNDDGVIFSFDPSSSSYKKLHDLDSANGSEPYGNLLQADNGRLYGLTATGGASNFGVVFAYDIDAGYYNKLKDLSSTEGGGPFGSFIQAFDGKLYSMDFMGGESNTGIIFSFDIINNTYASLYDFSNNVNGRGPSGSLIRAKNGQLYGMTASGGSSNKGVIFSFNPLTSVYTKLFYFDSTNGANGYGSLLQATDGRLYGMTCKGGGHNAGVIFSFDLLDSQFRKLHDFDTASGSNPYGSLIQAKDGKLYGMTYYGGIDSTGTIFSFNISSSTFTKLKDFNKTDGANPYGSLVQANNGKLYGVTRFGGDGYLIRDYRSEAGVIFSFDPSNFTYAKVKDFDFYNDGGLPFGSLALATDGKLYGMANTGGSNQDGTIFSYDPSSLKFTKIVDFDPQGSHPYGNLFQSADKNLYGMTYDGGANNLGIIFSLNTSTLSYNRLVDFSGANGANPYFGSGFIEVEESGPLPVILLSFAGRNNGNMNQLSWKVNNEDQLDYYELQRSNDGQSFSAISLIQSAGAGKYNYEDRIRTTEPSTYYYRLKIADKDGTIKYSDVIIVKANFTANFIRVNPNPFKERLAITIESALKEDNATIILYDVNGKQLFKQKKRLSAGSNVFSIDGISNLSMGSYALRIITSQQSHTIKIIKRK